MISYFLPRIEIHPFRPNARDLGMFRHYGESEPPEVANVTNVAVYCGYTGYQKSKFAFSTGKMAASALAASKSFSALSFSASSGLSA